MVYSHEPARSRAKKAPVTTRLPVAIAALAMLVGFVLFETWPAHPRTWMGWVLTVLVGVPLLLLGDYLGEAVHRRAPVDPGRRGSLKRVAWVLAVMASLTCIAFLSWRVQSQFLGEAMGRLMPLIARHYR